MKIPQSDLQQYCPENGFRCGWRCPDEGALVTWGGDKANLLEAIMGEYLGSAISLIYLIPKNQAASFAKELEEQVLAYGQYLDKNNYSWKGASEEVSLVASWHVNNSSWSLVGVFSTMEANLEEGIDTRHIQLVGSDKGNNTNTPQLIQGVAWVAQRGYLSKESFTAALVLSASLVDEKKPAHEVWNAWLEEEWIKGDLVDYDFLDRAREVPGIVIPAHLRNPAWDQEVSASAQNAEGGVGKYIQKIKSLFRL